MSQAQDDTISVSQIGGFLVFGSTALVLTWKSPLWTSASWKTVPVKLLTAFFWSILGSTSTEDCGCRNHKINIAPEGSGLFDCLPCSLSTAQRWMGQVEIDRGWSYCLDEICLSSFSYHSWECVADMLFFVSCSFSKFRQNSYCQLISVLWRTLDFSTCIVQVSKGKHNPASTTKSAWNLRWRCGGVFPICCMSNVKLESLDSRLFRKQKLEKHM